MKLLKYKGILFDEWTEEKDDDGYMYYWAEMCDLHGKQYKELESELSDGGAGGYCSLYGCDRTEESDENVETWYYVDFNPDLVEFVEVEE